MKTLKPFTEFETKYAVPLTAKNTFLSIINSLNKDVFFVEGPDAYYQSIYSGEFLRYRVEHVGLEMGRAEITIKKKRSKAKNNVIRKEINWRVDKIKPAELLAGIKMLGYKHSFTIYKKCFIATFKDTTLVFYTVKKVGSNKIKAFIEIELKEETIHKLTLKKAWTVIKKYETILKPLGICKKKRLAKSLQEIYYRKKHGI